MRLILLMVLLTLSIQRPVLAEAPEVELKRLQTILNTLNQELQAEYQHIRSLQEALRSNAQFPLLSQGRSPDVVAYEEVAGQERTALRREAALNAQLDVVYARVKQIEADKQPILDRLRDLIKTAPTPAPQELPATAPR
jgi:predicted RNase H-like nuclease (RuvC/YqgF family)